MHACLVDEIMVSASNGSQSWTSDNFFYYQTLTVLYLLKQHLLCYTHRYTLVCSARLSCVYHFCWFSLFTPSGVATGTAGRFGHNNKMTGSQVWVTFPLFNTIRSACDVPSRGCVPSLLGFLGQQLTVKIIRFCVLFLTLKRGIMKDTDSWIYLRCPHLHHLSLPVFPCLCFCCFFIVFIYLLYLLGTLHVYHPNMASLKESALKNLFNWPTQCSWKSLWQLWSQVGKQYNKCVFL